MTTHHEETDPQQAAWLVYINGIQIPCPRVVVNYGVWKIPEATLSFPPHRLLQRLGAEDRLEVAVFYLDNHYDEENPAFRLLFEGEICGWSYSSSPMGRMMTFNAIADISIFQTLYFFFMNTTEAAIQYTAAKDNVDSAGVPGVHYPFSIFKKGLFGTENSAIERPYDLLENVMRGVLSRPPQREDGGIDHRPIPAINFYMRWARKRNMVNRMIAMPLFEDDTRDQTAGAFEIIKAVQAEHALNAMATSLSQSVGDQGNVYDLIQKILGATYSELAMIPTAQCVRVRGSDGTILGPASYKTSTPEANEPLRLVNYFVKPQMLFGIPPSCNIIFPSMISSYSYSEQFWTQPTRVYVNDTFYAGAGINTSNPIVAAAMQVGYPDEVHAVLQARKANAKTVGELRLNGKNLLVYPEEFFKGPVVSRMPVPKWFTYLATHASKQNETDSQSVETSASTSENSLTELFKLYSQYEYYRSRYEQRGGSVDMIWNPYILPGFSCYIFDHRASALDTAGYVMNAMQTMDASGGGTMATSINYSFGRTINELFDAMKNDMARLGIVLGSAPVDPVDGVRRISQNFEKAEQFYGVLLHGQRYIEPAPAEPDNSVELPIVNFVEAGQVAGALNPSKKASADLRDLVAFVNDRNFDDYEENVDLAVISIDPDGDTAAQPDIGFLATNTGNRVAPLTNLGSEDRMSRNAPGPSRDVEPTNGSKEGMTNFEQIFNNGPKALKYISRPICTLEEYISFMFGGLSIDFLIETDQISTARHDFGYAELIGKTGTGQIKSSAVYYERIFNRTPGPPTKEQRPTAAQAGVEVKDPVDSPDGTTQSSVVVNAEEQNVLPPDFPQTRLNWSEILLAYRQQILERQSPQR